MEVRSNRGKQTESFFVAGIGFDGRNSASNPTAGLRLFVDSRRGKKTYPLPGDTTEVRVDRTRWNLGGEGYQRFGGQWLGVLKTAFDYLDTPEDSIPRWDLFAVGGANSLRGYREEQFLTKGSWLMQSEWRWLQGDRGSAVYLFADGGFISSSTGRSFSDIFTTFLYGVGVGVRQAHKLGILVVEYGVPRGESPLDGRIHLRIDAVF